MTRTTRTEELKNGATLTSGEVELYYWQKNRAGSFMTSLFQCIGKADITNRYRLSLGFPDEVQAFNDYQNTKGHWEEVQKIMQRCSTKC